jgi:hypothetical protein
MKENKVTRRKMLQASAAIGFLAAVPLSSALTGCRSKGSLRINANAWQNLAAPAPEGSICPRVSSKPDGTVVLSWLEPKEGGTAAFRLSIWRNEIWSPPVTIAEGRPFSRDRAAAPGVLALSSQNLIAYWSQKRPLDQTRNEIELFMAGSSDGGDHWTAPALVNRSVAQPGEDNGYASAAALDEAQAMLIWLDGRTWETEKRVALMARAARTDGTMSEVTVLDGDTCTCCSTSLARTGSGLLAAYRGHTPGNIRDISLVRHASGGWSQPRIVHPDRWHIEACPVNGPHLDSRADRAALLWFSAAQDQPEVKLAFSTDGGGEFSSAVRIDAGKAIGRGQVILLRDGSAVAFWLENDSGAARLLARRVLYNGTAEAPFEIARGANLGYPHAARAANGIAVTWAEATPASQVRVGLLKTAEN